MSGSEGLRSHRRIRRFESSGPGVSVSYAGLSPEVYRDSCRRLAWLALIYAAAYTAIQIVVWTVAFTEQAPNVELFWKAQIRSGIAIGFGLVVFFRARKGKLPPTSFVTTAISFEVVAALGITWHGWGWEQNVSEMIVRMGQSLGLPPDAIATNYVDALARHGLRPFYLEGVSWVGVWLISVPMMLPFSPTATVVGSLLGASTVPAVYLLSAALHGIPPTVAPWARAYLIDMLVPTYICAGIAILGSRVIYRLTHELSKARRMGSYQLVRKIGSGGMGEVWQAKHRMLARPAAIKLVRREALIATTDSGTAVRRFEREAQVIASLASPHTIVLYDFGVTDDGSFYYVMELLDGLDLRELIEEHGPVPADRARRILEQVCHSLDDAHTHGLIHRDVKPGNIFVCRLGNDYDFVKVLDFGLVKEAGTGQDMTQLTIDGITTGTPAFMAPEMALGKPIDARTDIYSLGCVAFWLVTGRLVFEGETAMAMVTRHVSETPPPPSSCTELEIPAALDEIILACLEKDPDRRPQSARELASHLRGVEGLEKSWTSDHAQRWWDAHHPRPAVGG
jgi:hypothetical protein